MIRNATITLLLLFLVPGATHAGGGLWYGDQGDGGNGLWSNPWSWENWGPPTNVDSATFSASKSYTVAFSSTAVAKNLYITAGTVNFDLGTANMSVHQTFISGPVGATSGPTLKIVKGTQQALSDGWGDQYIGYNGGTGTMEIGSGFGIQGFAPWFSVGWGTASIGNVTYPGIGTAFIRGGTFRDTEFVYVGMYGGIGTLVAEGSKTQVFSNVYEVGDLGGEGTLIVRDGATIRTFSNGSGSSIGLNGKGFVSISNGGAASYRGLSLSHPNYPASTAILNIEVGGAVEVFDGAISTYASADTQLNLNGGSLKAKSLDFQGDVSRFHWNSGTLWLNGGSILNMGSGSLQVNGKLMGAGTIVGNVSSSQEIAPGSSPGTLNLNGDLILNDGAKFSVDLGTISDQLNVSGKLVDASTQPIVFAISDAGGIAFGTPYTLLNFGSSDNLTTSDFAYVSSIPNFQGQFFLNETNLQFVAVVPEPSAIATLCVALAMQHLRRNRLVRTTVPVARCGKRPN